MQVDRSQLQDVIRKVLLLAVIGGAGGGALSAYTSSKANPQGETPAQRRHRILRNALVGTALGGAAGAAIPTGFSMLTQPYFGAPAPGRLDQRAAGHIARNAGTYLAGGLATGGLLTARMRDRATAFKHILGNVPSSLGLNNEEKLRTYLGASQGNRNNLIDRLVAPHGLSDVAAHKERFNWNEILGQAGYKGMSMDDMASKAGPVTRHAWEASTGSKPVLEALRQHLLESSSLPESVRGFGPAGLMSKLVGKEIGGVSLTPVARRYAEDFIRPGTKMLGGGRLGMLTRLGLAGGGVLGAKSVWDSMTGN